MTDEQPHNFLGKVSKVLEWIGAGILLAVFASVCVGLSDIVQGLWGLVRHGQYAGQEFRLAIHHPQLTHKIFKLDQAWWFILILPMLGAAFANQLGEWAEWLALPLDERRSRTVKARAEEKAKGDEARAELQARQEKVQAEKDEWRRSKMNKRPMSGWRRLWIVLSVLFGLPAFLTAFEDARRANVYEPPSEYVKSLQGQAYVDAYFAEASRTRTELKACVLSTVQMEDGWVRCDRNIDNAVFAGIGWALLPALLMMAVGLTVRWVYRGFRSAKSAPEAEASDPA